MPRSVIEKLDAPTRIKLRSTQILTSLQQIVSELVQNSLDAGASHIDVGLDCEEWMCWVTDDGGGITKEGLSLFETSSEEGRYVSSKMYQHGALGDSTFGFRGEALASAAEVCCLEISSRTARSRDTWAIITKGGKRLYSGPAVRWRRESPGTTVCIRDAFFNLPVRRLSHSSPARTLELIRQDIETFALVFPNVAFTFEDVHKQAGSSKNILRIPKTSSSLASFRNLYGRALVEHVEAIQVESGSLKLEGFISLNGAHSKGYQFLYVNHHPLQRCDLHNIIDSAFNNSTFGKNALDETGEVELPRSTTRRSPRKIQKRPVYVLNLTISTNDIDNCLEPAKTNIQFREKDKVVALLSSSMKLFLVQNGFLYHSHSQLSSGSNRASPAPRKRRKVAANDSGFFETVEPRQGPDNNNDVIEDPVIALPACDDDVSEITWTDPKTCERFTINSRSGHARPQTGCSPHESSREPGYIHRRTIPCYNDVLKETSVEDQAEVPGWLHNALQANKAYSVAERAIPKLSASASNTTEGTSDLCGFCPSHRSEPLLLDSDKHQYRFLKDDLRHAKIINQVDRKFIACLINHHSDKEGEGSPDHSAEHVLVLIDQHAADERVRVEKFLKDLCLGFLHNKYNSENMDGVIRRELSPSTPILLSLHEVQKLSGNKSIQDAFQYWGFRFVFPEVEHDQHRECFDLAQDVSNYAQVMVQSIPEIVADKLLLGNELRDLVKSFLAKMNTEVSSMPDTMPSDDKDKFSWLEALRWCPQELLDLVNSKACRGAIMFNDPLDIPQCEKLVCQLSETVFPFQCAHGRPSLVPLTNIGARQKSKKTKYTWSRIEKMLPLALF